MSAFASAFLASGIGVIAAAMIIEGLIGYPPILFKRVRHPVVWLGALISVLDRQFNRSEWPAIARRMSGGATVLIVLGAAGGVAIALSLALPNSWPGRVVEAAIASTLLAQRSLSDHVGAVATPLDSGDVASARAALAQIVGRDVAGLDENGMARAAIESLAENFSDGVIAPAFWGALLGLPGIALYKAINTLDSMIGHRTTRHEAFGWSAARLDDLANLAPARLSALLISAVALRRAPGALAAMVRDAGKHRSPNAGWPEAAMAGALDIRLSGPRAYHGVTTQEPWVNAGGRDARASDIKRALHLYWGACVFFGFALVLIVGALAR
jgi:adenosylcobinamide-phosphate synthase